MTIAPRQAVAGFAMSIPTDDFDLSSKQTPRYRWLRFSLKSLLIATALVAVYFGGRASMRPHWFAPQSGTWQLNMLSGAQRSITLTTMPDGLFRLDDGSSNFSGTYRWTAGELKVVEPLDKRYVGLAWKWDRDELVLVAEPPSRPAGPSYIGTRLRFVSPDISSVAQTSVPLVPSIGQLNQQRQPRVNPKTPQQTTPPFPPDDWHDPPEGQFQITYPRGAKRAVTLTKVADDRFELRAGSALSGVYQVRDRRLEIVSPRDPRMNGLAWAWQQDDLVLISEPSPPPTGSSYVGARIRAANASR